MENVMKAKTKSVNSFSWRIWRPTVGIWLIPFFLIPLSLPEYIINGIFGAGGGLLTCASLPPITVFKHRFSGPFVGAISAGLIVGLVSALLDFIWRYFGL